MTSKDNTKI